MFFFFFNDTATTEIYTLSLHDALPISGCRARQAGGRAGRAAWLGRRAGCGPGLRDTRSHAGLADAAGGGRAMGPARRTRPQSGDRARGGAGDAPGPRSARVGARP